MSETKKLPPETSSTPSRAVSPEQHPIIHADLALLARIIFGRKLPFFIFSIVSILLALGYSILRSPIYRAEILFSQPTISEYHQLHQLAIGHIRLMPREIFFEYKKNLSSRGNQHNFLTENSTKYFSDESNFALRKVEWNDVGEIAGRFRSIQRTWLIENEGASKLFPFLFTDILRINVYSELPERYFFNVSVEYNNAVIASNIANDYAQYVVRHTVRKQLGQLHYLIDRKKVAIEKQIAAKLNNARVDRENLIILLEEQARIADTLKYNGSATLTSQRIELMPLYFRGAAALRAQAKVLRARPSDRPFVHDLVGLEHELESLQDAPLELLLDQPAHIVRAAYPPTTPINSNMFILLAIGLFLGLALASVYNIFNYYLRQ